MHEPQNKNQKDSQCTLNRNPFALRQCMSSISTSESIGLLEFSRGQVRSIERYRKHQGTAASEHAAIPFNHNNGPGA